MPIFAVTGVQANDPEPLPLSVKTAPAGSLTAAAVNEMEKYEIMFLVVIDEKKKPVGVVHLHGILGGKNIYK